MIPTHLKVTDSDTNTTDSIAPLSIKHNQKQFATMDDFLQRSIQQAMRRAGLTQSSQPIPDIDEWLAAHEVAEEPTLALESSYVPPPTSVFDRAADVFDIEELREMILDNVPALDVVRATRINKTFRGHIHASHPLQRKTFMRSPPEKPMSKKERFALPRGVFPSSRYCEVIGWGRRLHQRHIRILPADPTHPTKWNEKPTLGLAISKAMLFKPEPVLHSRVMPMIALCPLLTASDPDDNDKDSKFWWRKHLQAAATGVYTGDIAVYAAARFNERAVLAQEPWTHMQISNPPTFKASAKIVWEGRVNGKLRVTMEGPHCVVLNRGNEGITFQSLVEDASSSDRFARGYVNVSFPVYSHPASEILETWIKTVTAGATLEECKERFEAQIQPTCTWTVSTRSVVHFDGVVTPTAKEVRRLADRDGESSTSLYLTFNFEQPPAEEDEDEDADAGADADVEDEDEEMGEDGDEGTSSVPQ